MSRILVHVLGGWKSMLDESESMHDSQLYTRQQIVAVFSFFRLPDTHQAEKGGADMRLV
jgi:hypothetical protein